MIIELLLILRIRLSRRMRPRATHHRRRRRNPRTNTKPRLPRNSLQTLKHSFINHPIPTIHHASNPQALRRININIQCTRRELVFDSSRKLREDFHELDYAFSFLDFNFSVLDCADLFFEEFRKEAGEAVVEFLESFDEEFLVCFVEEPEEFLDGEEDANALSTTRLTR